MSRFFSGRHAALTAYTPGEQPRSRQYIKLNTNESPFPPSEKVLRAAAGEAERLNLYSDPTAKALNEKAAEHYGVAPDAILMTNGSDEILYFAFLAFGDEKRAFAYPNISYGFYPVFSQINGIPVHEIPLNPDFTLNMESFRNIHDHIVIANPNAPTGLAVSPRQVETLLTADPDRLVIVDEAYVDFGGESCIPLTKKYDNLLVTRTFSKSYSLAGARLGFGIGNPALIRDLNTVKYSINPYNVNRMTMAAGIAALEDSGYYMENCRKIMENREYTKNKMREMGFSVTDSKANFLFAKHERIGGEALYRKLRERGILVRHFAKPEIADYNRITVGTREQMDALLAALKTILKEET